MDDACTLHLIFEPNPAIDSIPHDEGGFQQVMARAVATLSVGA